MKRLTLVLSVFLFAASLANADGNTVPSTLSIAGGRIDVKLEPGDLRLSHDELMQWVRRAGEAVAAYYGRYPVPHVLVRIFPGAGRRGVGNGQTFGYDGGGLIKIWVGSETSAAILAHDWMLTHEMVHLAFPSVAEQHHWIEEGLATYVEPIARIEAEQMESAEMWRDLVRDMPQGLPQKGDKGLDRTHTWARTYWGGALFCFTAELEIRKQTGNRKGLQDAMQAILAAGGDIRVNWKLEKAFKVGDQAIGASVLATLYSRMKDRPVQFDLDSIWKQLGVESDEDGVFLKDDAPLASVRRAITSGAEAERPGPR
jgi:hypothetical protein